MTSTARQLFYALGIVLLVSTSALAEEPGIDTGNGLLELCKASKDDYDSTCFGYIAGVTDLTKMIQAARGKWCFRPTTRLQLFETVLKFLEDHPERRHESSLILIDDALDPIFSCKKK